MVCTAKMRKATIENLKLLQKIGSDHQKEEATKELERREKEEILVYAAHCSY